MLDLINVLQYSMSNYSSWRIAESLFAELGYIVLAKEPRKVQAYYHSYVKTFFFFFFFNLISCTIFFSLM